MDIPSNYSPVQTTLPPEKAVREVGPGKPRLCFVADVEGWAFDNIAKNIAQYLLDRFQVEIVYIDSFESNKDLLRKLFGPDAKYDFVHFFWRQGLFSIFDPHDLYLLTKGLLEEEREQFLWSIARACKTTSIYDHMFLGESDEELRQQGLLELVDSYFVSSKILQTLYSKLPAVTSPPSVLADAVCLMAFQPKNLERLGRQDPALRVGWAGNSEWGDRKVDHKGLRTILIPLVEQLKKEGLPVEGDYCDRNIAWRSHETMADYYNSIDIYVCASLSEGTPNPVLEAMACGLPILSTDVGIVRDAFGPLQREYIVSDRDSPEFKEKLKELLESSELRRRLSQENLESIQAWNWKARAVEWVDFFSAAQDARRNGPVPEKQKAMLSHLCRLGAQQVSSHQRTINELSELRYALRRGSMLKASFWKSLARESWQDLQDRTWLGFLSLLPDSSRRQRCEALGLPTCYTLFDWKAYVVEHPDLLAANIHRSPRAAQHWLENGRFERRILKPRNLFPFHRLTHPSGPVRSPFRRPHRSVSKISVVTRVKDETHALAEQRHSLSIQSHRPFLNLVYSLERNRLCSIEEYSEHGIRQVAGEEDTGTSRSTKSLCFTRSLTRLNSTWLLFLDENEKLSNSDTITKLAGLTSDEDELLLWKIGFPGWQHPPIFPPKEIETTQSNAAGFLIHSKHIPMLVWDDYPGANSRLVRLLIRQLKPRWVDEVMTEAVV